MTSVPSKYPKFNNPEKFLKCRETSSLFSKIKGIIERRIISKLLRCAPGIRTVCDAPSGPGRLFLFWAGMGYRIYGVDISAPMARHAEIWLQQHGLQGAVIEGDVFKLAELLPETPDLVACIRFAYYFDNEARLSLLQALSRASSRYVLVQYKTYETYKGGKNRDRQLKRAKPKKTHLKWHFVSRSEIENELRQADLIPLAIKYVGRFSDRVFVLAEKKKS